MWQHNPMIVSGTPTPIRIDLGKVERGMTLQLRDIERYKRGNRPENTGQ